MKQINDLAVGDILRKRDTNEYCEIQSIERRCSVMRVFNFFGFCVNREAMHRIFHTDGIFFDDIKKTLTKGIDASTIDRKRWLK